MTGSTIAGYEILSRIGGGGMGEVCRAKEARLDRAVAIKALPLDVLSLYHALGKLPEPESTRDFFDESKIKLSHQMHLPLTLRAPDLPEGRRRNHQR